MSKHLKRLAAPRPWHIKKKVHVWSTRPNPGPHSKDKGIPLLIVVRDYLKLCDTAAEGRRIIGAREVLVDGRPAADYKRPVGFMDVISIPRLKANHRMLLDHLGRLKPVRIEAPEAKFKLVRIENKTTLKGGKTQLNMHDGRNIIIPKDRYRTGDVLKIEVPTQKIVSDYPMVKGNVAMVINGAHVGELSPVARLEVTRDPKPNMVRFSDGFSTIKDYVFMVGAKEPVITIPEVIAV